MTISSYDAFFQAAYGGSRQPYPWQQVLAESESFPTLLDVPTGLGKTAGVVLAWAWARFRQRAGTPRRLVFCLPMRSLVEQTCDAAREWMEGLAPVFAAAAIDVPQVYPLLGGHTEAPWDLYPERAAIIVGTQDMLLSRALNRGYAMSPYRWGMHFGLLHNDTLWVYDETQLMGPGLPTSAQLQGFRDSAGTTLPTHSLWMSATLGVEGLNTVDHPCTPDTVVPLCLSAADYDHPQVKMRVSASKRMEVVQLGALWAGNEKKGAEYMEKLTRLVLENHRQGTLTLVVVNRVARAQALVSNLRKLVADAGTTIAVVHSRFRAADRRRQMDLLLEGTGDRIVVATQAVEAGVDVSAATLVTELAPWSSLVQRIGRCNRYGEQSDARIIVVDPANGLYDPLAKEAADAWKPYAADDFLESHSRVLQLLAAGGEAGPSALATISPVRDTTVHPVVRRRDLQALFDTTSDLTGYDLDIARYIRDGDDRDVFVAWRNWDGDGRLTEMPGALMDDELVRVPFYVAQSIASRLAAAAQKLKPESASQQDTIIPVFWTPAVAEARRGRKSTQWVRVAANQIRTGMTLLLHAKWGGYQSDLGFLPETILGKVAADILVTKSVIFADDVGTLGQDPGSLRYSAAITLADHTQHVVEATRAVLAGLGFNSTELATVLEEAAHWHDAGKAHPSFQAMLYGRPRRDGEPLLAKSSSGSAPDTTDPAAIEEESAMDEVKDEVLATTDVHSVALESSSESLSQDSNANESVALEPEQLNGKHLNRGYLRHEWASTVLYLQLNAPNARHDLYDQVAWAISAHHGKLGVTLRPHPKETAPSDGRVFARGVWHGDELPAMSLGENEQVAATTLDVESLLRFGQGSWTDRMAYLLRSPDHGPFRLGLLEALLRAADGRASAAERTISSPASVSDSERSS